MPFAVAAIVLCVAAVAKLRAPEPAAAALAAARVPVSIPLIRLFAVGELAVGASALVFPSGAIAAVVAVMYAAFAVVALVLSRRGASCGCFGASPATASPLHAAISAALALVSTWVAMRPPAGVSWIFGRAPLEAGVLCLGIIAAAYATVVAYTELPEAWGAWSGR